ncbi:methionyl-tRNA formyltransferase [Sinimarinibacterium flocculans]|uniref:methionyl-tRNA formyltransferase n=1 Tax=Sinimarinibacterium flocculans TaxID=985250 RepID=UPI00351634F7
MRLVYMGTPDFAVPALRALLSAGHEIAAVYTQPPRPAGRGQREQRSPVHDFAAERGIPVRTPVSLKTAEAQQEFAALAAELAVVAAYGLILPKAILAAPKRGCLNIHASLLPRWRGAAPIQRAIEAGDTETGITIMRMDAGLDTGPMLLREAVPIDEDTTAADLHDRLAPLGARLIVEALAALEAGTLHEQAQPAAGATYASKLSKEEARVDWASDAAGLARRVRAFNPVPVAWSELDGERVRILAARSAPAVDLPPGTIVAADDLRVACGSGSLEITRLQWPGGRVVTAQEAMAARRLGGRRFA